MNPIALVPFRFAPCMLALLVAPAVCASDAQSRLSFAGLGKVRIGQPLDVVDTLVGPVSPAAPPAGDERCYYVTAANLPASVMLMIREGRVGRIDVIERGVQTRSGAAVGMSARQLKRLYGARLQSEPHKYAYPEGEYLTLRSADGRHAIRFETDGALVTSFYVGTPDTVALIEGCQ